MLGHSLSTSDAVTCGCSDRTAAFSIRINLIQEGLQLCGNRLVAFGGSISRAKAAPTHCLALRL